LANPVFIFNHASEVKLDIGDFLIAFSTNLNRKRFLPIYVATSFSADIGFYQRFVSSMLNYSGVEILPIED